jgi:serine phosphatase RsbU (regulator of sigma subunit)
MRTHLASVTGAARGIARRSAWPSRWLEFSALALITVVLVDCLNRPWSQPPMLAPLLAVPPALAGIGAISVRRPLAFGAISLLATGIITLKGTEFAGWLPYATMFTVVVITAVAAAGTAVSVRQERRIAEVRSVAEAAQRAVLRPLPPRLGPLGFDVVYVAAAAEAKVGGDLYEAVATREHGIRVIMGDVRGKGLGAVELAADVLGMFREQAHDACTLGELAARLDAGLSRSGMGRHEEFVTALLVEIDPESGRTSIFNCGHPAPLLISAPYGDAAPRGVSLMEVPRPAPPLGLLTLGDSSDAQLSCALQPNDQLLLYTDGITEARDAARRFYPLPERIGALAARAAAGQATGKQAVGKQAVGKAMLKSVSSGNGRPGLLDLVRADLNKHVGAPLYDDAALLLVRAPAAWPATRLIPAPARGAPVASAS